MELEDGKGQLTVSWNIVVNGVLFQVAELVSGLENHTVVKIASNAEGRHFLALTSDGCVFSWGAGEAGQLGLGEPRSVTC